MKLFVDIPINGPWYFLTFFFCSFSACIRRFKNEITSSMGVCYDASRGSISVRSKAAVKFSKKFSFSALKDRKKMDKTIIDSQERAFWRTVRPLVRFSL